MTEYLIYLLVAVAAVGFLVLIAALVVAGGSWWEARHPDEDLTVDGSDPMVDECGECGGPIYLSDGRCIIGKIVEDPNGGGTGSSATFHTDCCPDTGADHEHGTTTVRVGSRP